MGQVLPFPGVPCNHGFRVILTKMTLNSRTKFMVRVKNGANLVTDDVFFATYNEAMQVAVKDASSMARIHKQSITLEDRVEGFTTQVKK